ncbi:aldehyde dehydrogenase family protein [Akkermansiaceae bacterium]|nr:aldehyde dehydrogenase family protein [Akkermansiaceae bacterium]
MTSSAEIVSNQRKYFKSGNTRDVAARLDLLKRLETYLVDHQEDLLKALDADLGKPRLESFLSEYYFLIQEIKMVKKSLRKWLKPRKVKSPIYFKPCKSEVLLEPFGVVLIVSPWNYPIQLALSPMIAAIAAGNTVILKPSDVSSASECFLKNLVTECFSPEQVAVVTGDAEVAKELLGLRYDFIFYTGSTEVGRIVAGCAAKHLTPSVLELGGKCPCVVDSSANMKLAARRILSGKFFNGGQTCFAPDFVAVHRDVKSEFIQACEEVLEEVPWEQEMAHVINEQHYDRLHDLLESSKSREIKKGLDDTSRHFMAPRILPDAQWSEQILKDEVFGPILSVVTFEDTEGLVGKLQGYESPLAFYIFSENAQWIDQMQHAVQSGGVCINDTMKQGSNLDLPFGGVGDSGYGRYRGKEGVVAMSYQRGVVRRSMRAPKFMDLLPPYGKAYEWVKKMMG